MNYNLNTPAISKKKSPLESIKSLFPLLKPEYKSLGLAFVALIINTACSLATPLLFGYAVDTFIQKGIYSGAIIISGILFLIFLVNLVVSYLQTNIMGTVGQRVLFTLRNNLFHKIQELPIAFFNQNKAGDLISRINNDTDKLNQFFSQSLVQFFGNIFIMIGAGIFIISIHPTLGLAALSPTIIILATTILLSPWIKKKNTESMSSTGKLSSEIQESLGNFKVILAFNRRDYFRNRFKKANQQNFDASLRAGIANQVFTPIYGLAYNIAQIIVLAYGIYLISLGSFSIGLLISFLAYINRFYEPLRFMASLWTSFQVAMAGWDRVSEILGMKSNLTHVLDEKVADTHNVLTFSNVTFGYEDKEPVLSNINFNLEKGKTYALVGPTGGGKTTTASLMARLYDPTSGSILLEGKDIRSYSSEARTKKVGFILQDPFLFTGTVRENILYGNDELSHLSSEDLLTVLQEARLEKLIAKFSEGLNTKVSLTGDSLSLGQKQLIAFIRAVLRKPSILILDEATANIDTMTEQLLETILENLPKETSKVIIAHRLNTIENADEIFFVNGGTLTLAHSMKEAIDMLLHDKRQS